MYPKESKIQGLWTSDQIVERLPPGNLVQITAPGSLFFDSGSLTQTLSNSAAAAASVLRSADCRVSHPQSRAVHPGANHIRDEPR